MSVPPIFASRSWRDYAIAAGVPDLKAFDACLGSEAPLPRIEAGQQLAKRLGIGGTPTLIINGWRLASPPSSQELEKMIAEILAGRSPVNGKR